jgi:hypothetical protein
VERGDCIEGIGFILHKVWVIYYRVPYSIKIGYFTVEGIIINRGLKFFRSHTRLLESTRTCS